MRVRVERVLGQTSLMELRPYFRLRMRQETTEEPIEKYVELPRLAVRGTRKLEAINTPGRPLIPFNGVEAWSYINAQNTIRAVSYRNSERGSSHRRIIFLHLSDPFFTAPTTSTEITTTTARQPTDKLRSNSAPKLSSHTDDLVIGLIRYPGLDIDFQVDGPQTVSAKYTYGLPRGFCVHSWRLEARMFDYLSRTFRRSCVTHPLNLGRYILRLSCI